MKARTLEHLDYEKILTIFEEFSRTPGGRKAMRHLMPSFSRERIQEIYDHCLSLQGIVAEMGICPLEGVPSLAEVLGRLQVKGVVLDAVELLDVALFIGKLREIATYFKKAEEKTRIAYAPVLEHGEGIPILYALKKAIETAIDPTGFIKDHASPRLKELRRKAERQKHEIQTILERMIRSKRMADQIADQYLTIRNGRYVLPVKAGAKQAIPGIIHDQSQSRLTFFIEPMACVPLNNALALTYQEMEREEEAIRRQLTHQVAEHLSLLCRGWQIVTEVDLIHARVLYMEAYHAWPLELRDTPGGELRQMRHPLLLSQKAEKVIPIDLEIPEGKRMLILSGVNAGGKTVTLKTLGVAVLMLRAALPVPAAKGSDLYPFEEVFTEIGDEQNMADDLSTFTAHIQHLQEIIGGCSADSLVLIDEIGAGTGMSEGAALALGILDVLGERGATVMVTTHFELLKGYGARHPLAINVSVAFDAENMRPLYRLCYGIPGNSNAFETARRYGLGAEVLTAAQRYRSRQDRLLADLMGELEALKLEAEREKEAVSDARREILRLRDQFKQTYGDLIRKKEEILKKFQMKWDQQVKKQRQTFQKFLQNAKEGISQAHAYHAFYSSLKGEFNRMVREPFREEMDPGLSETPDSGEVNVGDDVYVTTVGQQGQITEINRRQGMAEVTVRGMRLQVPLKKLRKREGGKVKPGKTNQQTFVGVDVRTEARPELNVVGYRVQEALPEVDKFIDTALVHRMKEVTIIHGIGTGRLRGAIRDYLANHEGIEAFADGDIRRGGRGITVVRLS